jgi:hypothetical protein
MSDRDKYLSTNNLRADLFRDFIPDERRTVSDDPTSHRRSNKQIAALLQTGSKSGGGGPRKHHGAPVAGNNRLKGTFQMQYIHYYSLDLNINTCLSYSMTWISVFLLYLMEFGLSKCVLLDIYHKLLSIDRLTLCLNMFLTYKQCAVVRITRIICVAYVLT